VTSCPVFLFHKLKILLTNKNNLMKLPLYLLSGIVSTGVFLFIVVAGVFASDTTTLTQTINEGNLSVDIVDDTGESVTNPGITFPAQAFSFNDITSVGTLGTSSERIRTYNPTSTDTWSVTLAASATTNVWTDGGSNEYDFNDDSGTTDGTDTDSVGGQMTINPSGGTLSGVNGCAISNVSLGSSTAFTEGVTDSVDILSASSGAATFCRWDLTDVELTQEIPGGQAATTYTIDMVLTIS
jgi:hypothetical protein